MATYPTTLPAPLAESYALSPVDQTVRTDMETGSARVRRRTRARNDLMDISFMFSDEQFQAFREWFEDDVTGISGGASWFFITLPIGKGGPTTEEVRFKAAWKAGKVGQCWRVSAQVEVR
jgi:hypothetical protein